MEKSRPDGFYFSYCNTVPDCFYPCIVISCDPILHGVYILYIYLDINECEQPETYSCYGTCLNFPGTFQCQCRNGTYGNPFAKGGCIIIKNSNTGNKPLCAPISLFSIFL